MYSNSLYLGFRARTVKIIIIINIVVFILIHVFPTGIIHLLGFTPRELIFKFKIWQILTYTFVHINLWHLIIEMLMLYFFASQVENSWGRREFLLYYFICSLASAVPFLIFHFNTFSPLIGTGGVIFGILVAYSLMYPDDVILLFFIFPMRMRQAILVFAGIELLTIISSSDIYSLTHLGGGIGGYLYLKSEFLRRKMIYLWQDLKHISKNKIFNKEISREQLDREVDRILDKISKYGVKSLTKKEKKILEMKSRYTEDRC